MPREIHSKNNSPTTMLLYINDNNTSAFHGTHHHILYGDGVPNILFEIHLIYSMLNLYIFHIITIQELNNTTYIYNEHYNKPFFKQIYVMTCSNNTAEVWLSGHFKIYYGNIVFIFNCIYIAKVKCILRHAHLDEFPSVLNDKVCSSGRHFVKSRRQHCRHN